MPATQIRSRDEVRDERRKAWPVTMTEEELSRVSNIVFVGQEPVERVASVLSTIVDDFVNDGIVPEPGATFETLGLLYAFTDDIRVSAEALIELVRRLQALLTAINGIRLEGPVQGSGARGH